MNGLRDRIEDAFGRWTTLVVRFPWILILLVLASTLVLASRVSLLQVETSTDDYLRARDPETIAYDDFREQFGRDQMILIAIEPDSVFDLEFLDWLETFHADIESSVPHLDEVKSLLNVRSIYANGDSELIVEDLMAVRPTDARGLAALRARVLGTPAYLDAFISQDGRVTALKVKANAFSDGPERDSEESELGGFEDASSTRPRRILQANELSEFCRALIEVVDRHRRPDREIYVTGQPLVAYALTRSMAQDIPKIFGAALAIVGILLVGIFRRFSPLLLSATIVVMSLLSTLGFSELLGFGIGLPAQILPPLLLAIGVSYVVHFLTIFFRLLGEGYDRPDGIELAMRHVGLPMLMTAITTVAGLASFATAETKPAYQLGMMGAIGVTVTLVYTLTFLPAVLSLLPLRPNRNGINLEGGTRFLSACSNLSVRRPKVLSAVAVVIAVGSALLLPRLDHSADPMSYFEPDHWLRSGTFFVDDRMGGMQTLEVVVDTGRVNGVQEVEMLDRMDALDALVLTLGAEGERVTRSWSMLQVLKETHRALNEGRDEAYAIPRDPQLVAQELLLFENSGADDLENFVDSQFSKARLSILTRWEDGVEKHRFIERIRGRVNAIFEGQADVTLTGAVKMVARMSTASSETFIQSYLLALALITPLMMILIGNVRAGLISMVPNLVPLLASLALMVIVGIELDLFTILGGCIAIGLAVDDSIHFISGFRRHFALTGDAQKAVELTMASTGRALLFTSIVLVAGFSALGFSSMANLGYLGMTTAFAIGLAFLLDVTVTPALLYLTHRRLLIEKMPGG